MPKFSSISLVASLSLSFILSSCGGKNSANKAMPPPADPPLPSAASALAEDDTGAPSVPETPAPPETPTPPETPPVAENTEPPEAKPQGPRIDWALVNEKVFTLSCIRCHSAPGNAGGINLETYANVKENIDLIKDAATVAMIMPPRRPLQGEALDLLKAWIEAGAPELLP